MAQAGYTSVNLYYSSTATNVPLAANMGAGELALNTADGKLFYKSSAGVVTLLVQSGVGSVTTFSAGSTGFTPSTATSGAVTLGGTLASSNGGTGQSAAFTQYGITYASTTTALATTAAGTSTTVLHGNASGAPTFGAVSLTADVSGTLPIANGGTNSTATPTAGGIGYGTGSALAYTAVGTAGQALISAAGSAPAFGTLGVAGGGTGQTAYSIGDILYASSSSALSKLGLGTANQVLAVNSGGTGLTWTSAAASGVSSISFGTTGLTPSGTGTGAVTVAGTLATTNGGTGLISFNANGAVYASSSSALTTGTLPTTGGGTGLSSFTTNGAVYATSSSALATGTLPTASGGTGLITYTAGDLVYSSATNTLGKLNIGTAGYALVSTGTAPSWVAQYSSITFIIDGGGAAITTGIKGDLTIPFNCTITEWTILADQSGSIVVDVWKDVYANYPPTVADTITASAKPTVTSSIKNQSSTLTGWTTTITSGDTLRFNVDSVATIQRITISLKVYRT